MSKYNLPLVQENSKRVKIFEENLDRFRQRGRASKASGAAVTEFWIFKFR